jgi:hypothetical protein
MGYKGFASSLDVSADVFASVGSVVLILLLDQPNVRRRDEFGFTMISMQS